MRSVAADDVRLILDDTVVRVCGVGALASEADSLLSEVRSTSRSVIDSICAFASFSSCLASRMLASSAQQSARDQILEQNRVRGRDAREILVVLQQQAVITSPGTIKAAAADVTAPVTSMLLVHVRPLP